MKMVKICYQPHQKQAIKHTKELVGEIILDRKKSLYIELEKGVIRRLRKDDVLWIKPI